MRRLTMMALFLTIFTLVITLMHYYVLGRLLHWLGVPYNLFMIIITICLVLLFPVANIISAKWSNYYTHVFYDVGAVWLGSITILLIAVIGGEVVNVLAGPLAAATAVLIASAVAIPYSVWNADHVRVRRFTITGDVKKPSTFAVASDIHAGPVHGKQYLSRITHLIHAERPDMLFLPGDLVDGPGVLPDDILEPLRALRIPIFYSFGNHEEYVGAEHVARVLQGSGVTLLRDEGVTHGEFFIMGVDDREDRDALKKFLPRIPKNKYSVLLYHRPDGLATAAENGINLMLSGHTHNGQLFPFTLLVKLRFPNIKGWYRHGNTQLYVSTGAGTWGPPMRLGSQSEVVFITVRP